MKNKFLKDSLIKIFFIIFIITSIFFDTLSLNNVFNSVKEVKINSQANNEIESLSNDNTLHLTNEYATNYFYNLTDNFGVNEMGSCGYVALGMLLGYYDTYWDDNIVPETFEQTATLPTNNFSTNVSSPGGKSEKDLLTGITGNQYYTDASHYYNNIVLPNYNQYLHLNLIYRGNSLGYYDSTAGRDAGGLSESKILELTQNYLNSISNLNSQQIAIESVSIQPNENIANANLRIRMFVEERVKQGIPVLISASQSETLPKPKKHAMIAYDFDVDETTNNQIIYVHTGLRDVENEAITHVNLNSTTYTNLTSAIALVPKTNHSHTANYKYGTNTYCPCTNETYYKGTISFQHLNCLISNGVVTNNNSYIQNTDAFKFDCRTAYSLANIEAYVPTYGYDPYHIFLGWYTDDDFTTKIETISAGTKGLVKLYARWRVDYRYSTHNREYTITNAGAMNNSSDQIVVASVADLQKMQQMGITKMTIKLYINMWEVVNGKQYVYLYGGSNGTNLLASKEFTDTTGSPTVKEVRFTVNIADLQATPYVYVRYNASESKFLFITTSHDWKNNKLHAEISFVNNESDVTGAGMPGFTWGYDNPLV